VVANIFSPSAACGAPSVFVVADSPAASSAWARDDNSGQMTASNATTTHTIRIFVSVLNGKGGKDFSLPPIQRHDCYFSE
jgi:hypothetical protein